MRMRRLIFIILITVGRHSFFLSCIVILLSFNGFQRALVNMLRGLMGAFILGLFLQRYNSICP